MPSIRDIAASVGLRGSGSRRFAEPPPRQVPVIDNSGPGKNVTTSLDTYVAGEYIGRGGRRIEVTQRYTVFVSYGRGEQVRTMQQVRSQIMSDFARQYNQLNMTSVHIPELRPVEVEFPASGVGDVEFYERSTAFRDVIRRASFDIETERLKAGLNVQNIKERYDV